MGNQTKLKARKVELSEKQAEDVIQQLEKLPPLKLNFIKTISFDQANRLYEHLKKTLTKKELQKAWSTIQEFFLIDESKQEAQRLEIQNDLLMKETSSHASNRD